MNGEILQRKVTIVNPQGLHMRPQAAFAELANRFPGSVHVIKGDLRVNGKSMLELLLLAAEQGTELIVEVTDGPGAHEALDALVAVLEAPEEEFKT
jgi:phosphotransferase system HPr (HPr) family protein